MLGLIVLAYAPNALVGGLGVMLAVGIAFNVTRAVSVIWVNRRTTSDVRATVHSFLSQAEKIGGIAGGFALAFLARASSISVTLVTSAVLVAGVGVLVARSRADSRDRAGSPSMTPLTEQPPICPTCGVTMVPAALSALEQHDTDWICVECEEVEPEES